MGPGGAAGRRALGGSPDPWRGGGAAAARRAAAGLVDRRRPRGGARGGQRAARPRRRGGAQRLLRARRGGGGPRAAEPGVRASPCRSARWSSTWRGCAATSRARCESGRELARRGELDAGVVDADLRALALVNLGIAELWTGELDAAGRHLERARRAAADAGHDWLVLLRRQPPGRPFRHHLRLPAVRAARRRGDGTRGAARLAVHAGRPARPCWRAPERSTCGTAATRPRRRSSLPSRRWPARRSARCAPPSRSCARPCSLRAASRSPRWPSWRPGRRSSATSRCWPCVRDQFAPKALPCTPSSATGGAPCSSWGSPATPGRRR